MKKPIFVLSEKTVKDALRYSEVPVTKANLSKARRLLREHLTTRATDVLIDFINDGEFISEEI